MKSSLMVGDDFFNKGDPRICVMSLEHHGHLGSHYHKFIEFVFIDHGFALHSHNGITTVLTAGDLFAIPPGDVHDYISAYHTSLYNCLFYMEDLDETGEEISMLPGFEWIHNHGIMPKILHVDISERHEISSILDKIMREQKCCELGWKINVKALLVTFLLKYSRLVNSQQNIVPEGEKIYYGYVFKILQYIEENYSRDISQKDLADYVSLSPDYMSRRFKAVMNMTPSEYIRKFRVAKAMEFLKMTDEPVSAIANKVGFNDICLFSRSFKSVVGVSPVSFRKSENYDIVEKNDNEELI